MTEFSAASEAQFHMILDVTLFCVLAVCVAFAGAIWAIRPESVDGSFLGARILAVMLVSVGIVGFAGYRGHHHALETVELKKAGCAAVQAVDGDRWFSPGELVSIERLCGRDVVAVVLAAAAPVDGTAVGGGATESRDRRPPDGVRCVNSGRERD